MKQLDQDSDERKNRLIMPHYPTVSFPMGVSTGEFNFCGPQVLPSPPMTKNSINL
jgi:hypothetical protein